MASFYNLRGTTQDQLMIGKGGPQIRRNTDTIEIRNNANNAYETFRSIGLTDNAVGTSLTLQDPGATSSSVVFAGAAAITLPIGNTAARPSTGVAGMIRYNSQTSQIEIYDGGWDSLATLTGTELVTNKTFEDSTVSFVDDGDNSKALQFQLSGITTSTTRTLTIPNASGTILLDGDIPTTEQAELAALDALGNGIVAKTADATYAARTITGTANLISVTNGDGVSGNPTLTIPSTMTFPNSADVAISVADEGGTTSAGQNLTIQSGAGGTLTTGGVGGNINLIAGAAGGSGNNAGGDINLTPGVDTGSGVAGTVNFLDSITNTKIATFDLSGITAANTRTMTIPDASGTLVLETRTVTAGVGLSGGGDLSADITLTVDLNELTTDATGGASGDFLAFVDITETNASNKVLVSDFITNAGLIPDTRTVTAGVGLSGGGALSGNITLTVDLNELTTDATGGATTDHLVFTDTTESNASNKVLVSDFITNAAILPLAGGTLTGALTLNADPSANLHAATKQYVDATATGLDVKDSVRAATTGSNITLSGGAPDTLDGVSLAANDRLLVKDQSTGNQNGIYEVTTLGTGANGTWTRTTDADADAEVTAGLFVLVTEGTLHSATGWLITTNDPITVDTTTIVFAQFSALGDVPSSLTLTAGVGLSGGGDLSTNRTFTVDLNELVTDATGGASGDFLAFVDITDANASNKVLVSDFITNAGLIPNSRTITAGNGLSGGGDLTSNKTIDVDLNELTTDATGGASGDFLVFVDITETNASNKVLVSDFISNAAILTATEIPATEQAELLAIDALAAGMVAKTADATYAARTITGTTSEIVITNGSGVSGNPTIGIADNPILTGTSGVVLPIGTNAQEVGTTDGEIRYDSQSAKFRARESGAWTDLIPAGGGSTLTSLTDTNITTPAAGSLIVWDTTPGEWVDALLTGTASEVEVTNADGSVTVGLPASVLVTTDLGIGTATTDRTLHAAVDDASNAAITQVLRLTHTTSGAPTLGIGAGIEFEVETATAENLEIGAVFETVTTDVTTLTEDFDFVWRLMAAGATAAEKMRLTSAGVLSATTFSGALSGNATSASTAAQWTTTRTIGMSGDVTSDAVNIDGSGNVTITNTVVGNDSHTHDMANLAGTVYAAGSGASLTALTAANISTGSLADNVDLFIVASETAADRKVLFTATTNPVASANMGIEFDTASGEFTYNPSTDTLTVGTVAGALSGNATTATTATTATNSTTSNLAASANTTASIVFAEAATGDQALKTDAELTYNATTNALTTTTFIGALSGNATTATTATTATNSTTSNLAASANTTASIVFAEGATGDQALKTDAELTYNATTNALTTTTFIGALTGNASTATTAAAWTTTRTIGMSGDVTSDAVNIDGSGNVTITNTVVGNDSHTHDMANLTGTVYAAGSGASLTAITAANISDGTLGAAVIPTITASSAATVFKVPFVNTSGHATVAASLLLDDTLGNFTYQPSTGTLIADIFTGTTFNGDLNGTINTATTGTTQSASDNSTKIATTAYVDAAAGGGTLASLSDTNVTTPANGALLIYDTTPGEWVDNTIAGTTNRIVVTNGQGTITLDIGTNVLTTTDIPATEQAELLAIDALAAGMVAKTADATYAARTITGTASEVDVSNGDGVSGNPTIGLPASVLVTTDLGIGTATTDRTLHAAVDDASNAAITQVLRLTHTTSGVPTLGIGAGIEFEVETATAQNQEIGAVFETVTTDVTTLTEDFDFVWRLMAAGAAAAEKMRLTSAGVLSATTFSGDLNGTINTATTGTTQTASNNSTLIATTAYVDAQVATENTLAEMNDVTLTTPADADLLLYDTGTAMWRDATMSGDASIGDTGIITVTQAVTAANSTTSNLAASANTTASIVFAEAATGDQALKTDAELTYNATTNALTTTTFIGALTGNASTASTAAQWTTTRTIGMSGDVTSDAVNIDGSGNITITNTVVGNDSHTHDMANLTGTVYAAGSGASLTALTAANISAGSLADNVDLFIVASETAADRKVLFTATTNPVASANMGIEFDTASGEFTYNPSTDTLTVGTVAGALSGNATTATTATTATNSTTSNLAASANTTASIVFAEAATGDQALKTDAELTYNATTNALTTTTFIGDLNGTINTATTGTTQSPSNNSTLIATTAYVDAATGGGGDHATADAATNTVTSVVKLTHTTSATPAIGIGVGMQFETESSVANNEIGSTLDSVTTNVGLGTEDFDFVFNLMAGGAAVAERMRISSGSNLTITSATGVTPRITAAGADTDINLELEVKGTGTVQIVGSSGDGTLDVTSANNTLAILGSVAAGNATLEIRNDDQPATGETTQGDAIDFVVQKTINSGGAFSDSLAGRIALIKEADFWHATTAADEDASLAFSTINAGTLTELMRITNTNILFKDQADNTKVASFDMSGITTANTRTLTIQDLDGTVAYLGDITAANISDGTLGAGVIPTITASTSASVFKVPFANTTGHATAAAALLLDDAIGNFTYQPSTGTLVADIFTGTTFNGDLNGTINTATTATTQSASDNSTKVATTAYVDAAAGGGTLASLTDTNVTTPANGALLIYDTTPGEWIDNTIAGTTNRLVVTNGQGTITLDIGANVLTTTEIPATEQAELLAIDALAAGMVAKTADATYAARTITGTASEVDVSNGDGVSGNPTIGLPASVLITTGLGVGTATADRTLHAAVDDASNAAITQVLRLTHTTSGVPTLGIGAGIEFEVETATAQNQEIGAVFETVTTDVTTLTEDFDFVWRLMAAGATAAEKMRLTSAGVLSATTFSGALSGNATSATTAAAWTTTRTINMTGDVTSDAVNIDGSGNITITNTIVGNDSHTHDMANLAGTVYAAGSGASLTALTAANISDGTLGAAVIPTITASTSASVFKVPFANTTGHATAAAALLLDDTLGNFTYQPSTGTLTADIFTGTTFSGDLNGTINTATTAVTQSASDNSTKVATTAYADAAGGSATLAGLTDTNITTPVAGAVIIWDTTPGEWVDATITGTTNRIDVTNADGSITLDIGTNVLTTTEIPATEQAELLAIDALAAGMVAKTADATYAARTITGTASEIVITNGSGVSGNPTIGIADNPILTGTSGVVLPTGTTGEEVGTTNGEIRYNSTSGKFRAREAGAWVNMIGAGGGGGEDLTGTTNATTIVDGIEVGASAVNYVEIRNANAAAMPLIRAAGTDTDIDLEISAKGTGKIAIVGSSGNGNVDVSGANNIFGVTGSVAAGGTSLQIRNDDQPATGETTQTAFLDFVLQKTINSGGAFSDSIAGRIELIKEADFWHATTAADEDSAIAFSTMLNGTLSEQARFTSSRKLLMPNTGDFDIEVSAEGSQTTDGKFLNLIAGAGGTLTTGGAGGGIFLTAGNAGGSGDNSGGELQIQSGTATGAGDEGRIVLVGPTIVQYSDSSRPAPFGMAPLTVDITYAATATVSRPFKIASSSTSTPAVGIGTGIEFEVETAAANNEIGATIDAVTTGVGAGVEAFDLVFNLMESGNAVVERLRLASDGDLTGSVASFTNVLTVGTVDQGDTFQAAVAGGSASSVTRIARFNKGTGGTPVAGIGVGLNFDVESLGGQQNAGQLDFVATNVGSGTEDFDFVVNLMTGGAAPAEVMRITDNGSIFSTAGFVQFEPDATNGGLDIDALGITKSILVGLGTGDGSSMEIAAGFGFTTNNSGGDLLLNAGGGNGTGSGGDVRLAAGITGVSGVGGNIVLVAGVGTSDGVHQFSTPFGGDIFTLGITNLTADRVIEVPDTAGTFLVTADGSLNLIVDDASNSSVTEVLKITHTTSGSPANGIGVGMAFETEITAGVKVGSTIESVVTDVGATSDFMLEFNTVIGGASPTTRLGLWGNGSSNFVELPNSNEVILRVEPEGAVTSDGKALWIEAGDGGSATTGGIGGPLFLSGGFADGSGNNAGGRIEMTPGTGTGSGIDGQVVMIQNNVDGALVTNILKLSHTTSAAAAIGIGVGMEFEVETATSNNFEIGGIFECVSTDITTATEDFDFVFRLMTAGAAAAEKFRISSAGNVTATTFTGTATAAQYSDLAEYYKSDCELEPGDIVMVGGSKEITKCNGSFKSIDVFGVVSTQPGLMLNTGLRDVNKAYPIALSGRVPVKVVGLVRKGQRLVQSGIDGIAVAIDNSEVLGTHTLSIIGRSLEAKETEEIGLIEAVVTIK